MTQGPHISPIRAGKKGKFIGLAEKIQLGDEKTIWKFHKYVNGKIVTFKVFRKTSNKWWNRVEQYNATYKKLVDDYILELHFTTNEVYQRKITFKD